MAVDIALLGACGAPQRGAVAVIADFIDPLETCLGAFAGHVEPPAQAANGTNLVAFEVPGSARTAPYECARPDKLRGSSLGLVLLHRRRGPSLVRSWYLWRCVICGRGHCQLDRTGVDGFVRCIRLRERS